MYETDYTWMLWATFGVIGGAALILVLREIVLWYFRIPEIVALLKKIAEKGSDDE